MTPLNMDKNGKRKRSERALQTEATAVILGAISRNKRKAMALGFYVDLDHITAYLDEDSALTRRVLTSAGFTPDGGNRWRIRAGHWDLAKVLDYDVLVDICNHHRPV